MYFRASEISISLFSLLSIASTFTSDELRVTLSNGSKLVGRYLRSYSGRPIKAFTNIPYAKPPVGYLRFRDPEPLEKWDGECNAVDDGPVCPQRNPFIRSYEDIGSEDCLRLNVYVPHSFEGNLSNLSVLVVIHGGGFVCSSGSRNNFGPDHFLDQDVILVSGNYRLGTLGFLSTEDENCPGNFGLKDQVMILKWIQQNIKQFCGNPESVTLYGGSSGGASVTYLMASPLAEGLFSKAIAYSGTDLASWAQSPPGVARQRAIQLAQHFNCYIPNDWPKSIDCLRMIPAKNMSAVVYEFYEFDMDPKVIFTPVVEPKLPGAFITEHPRDVIPESSLKIPFMTGINYDEGLIKSAPIFNIPGLFDKFVINIYDVLPIMLYYNHYDSSVQKSITDKINEFYFKSNLTKDNEQNVTNLIGDEWYLSAVDSYLRMRLSHKNTSSTYVFLLTHKTNISFTAVYHGDPDTYYGVSHSDEMIYLFPTRMDNFPRTLPTKGEEQIREAMITMWVNFARTGNPTPTSGNFPPWKSVEEIPVNYYRFGNDNFENKPMFGMETGGLFEDRAQFWREIQLSLKKSNHTNETLESSLTSSRSSNYEQNRILQSIFICICFFTCFH